MAIRHISYIPEYITVHPGQPQQPAMNVDVPFPEYIKNAASCVCNPTWPESALRAIIYAIISYAYNRIYTGWYRNQGYDFDITNSEQFDLSFVCDRTTFDSINRIVDECFNDYICKQNTKEPYLSQLCHDGTGSGLLPRGTIALAEQGLSPIDILRHYYGDEIEIVRNAPINQTDPAYPEKSLRLGAIGKPVRFLQMQLNRIAGNYPSIAKIVPIDGHFLKSTRDAVSEFQHIFHLAADGVVGKATWYKLRYVFNAVKRLGQLSSEGLQYDEITFVCPVDARYGYKSAEAKYIQYYLNVISIFIPVIPGITMDGILGPKTKDAILRFQRLYHIEATAVIDSQTVLKIVEVYRGIIKTIDNTYRPPSPAKSFPGQFLDKSVKGGNVTTLQMYLQKVAQTYTNIPSVEVTGIYDHKTYQGVLAFQKLFGILQTGDVGPNTWNALADEYNELTLAGFSREPA